MSSIPTFELNTGAKIPAIGLGAWASPDDRAKAAGWFTNAFKNGYRHIDTAWIYGTEVATGEAIRASGIPRSEIFVTTKLPWHHYDRVAESFEESLKNIGLDYIDLYLLHFPQAITRQENGEWKDSDGNYTIADYPFTKIWADMEKLLDTGKVKAIGISNFSIKNTEELLKTAKVVPAVNQVELHPYLSQNELVEYSKNKGIVITAYTPTGYATVREDPTIQEIAKKHNSSGAQVILSWHVSRGTVAVPRSSNEQRQKDNLNLIHLDEEDIKKINGLDRNERLCNKADANGKMMGWTYEQLGW